MNRLDQVYKHKTLRKARIRSRVTGTSERPRMTIYISNKNVSVQIIDDVGKKTLLSASSLKTKPGTDNMTQIATKIGTEIAEKAKAAKIKRIVFDRSGRLYHGRVKALAEAARAGGLEF